MIGPKSIFKKPSKISIFRPFGLSKTLPKPFQNPSKIDVQKNIQFFRAFEKNFSNFKTSKPWKYQFYIGKITIFKVFAKIVSLQLSCIFGQKNLPKTLPKRGPNPSKIDAKNASVFNIDFLGFRPRFWSLLGLKVGAKLGSKLAFQFKRIHERQGLPRTPRTTQSPECFPKRPGPKGWGGGVPPPPLGGLQSE